MRLSSEYNKLFKDTGIFAIGSFGSKLITLLFVPLYTACLSTSEYGIADILVASVNLIYPILTLSVSEGVLRFCYQKDVDKGTIINIAFNINIYATLINIALAFILKICIPSISEYIGFYIVIFSLTAIEHSAANFLKGQERTKLFAIQGIIHTGLVVVSNIILLLVFKVGLNGFFYSLIFASFGTTIFMCIAGKFLQYSFSCKLDKHVLKQMLQYSLPLVPATVAWWINSSADKYMITDMLGSGANGIYSVAHKIPTIIFAISGVFTQAWQISAMKNYGNDTYPQMFANIIKGVNCLLILGSCLIILLCKPLAKFLFLNDFYVAWKYVPLLVLAVDFSIVAGVLASAYTASKQTNILFISTAIGALINIIANLFLIKVLGLTGAALSTVISFFFMVLIRYIVIRKKIIKLHICATDIISYILILSEIILLLLFDTHFYIITSAFLVIIALINIKNIRIFVKFCTNKK